MLQHLLAAVTLVTLLASRAQASQINLLLTTDYNSPLFGQPPGISLRYNFFASPTNEWPTFAPTPPSLASGGAALLPGVSEFTISLDAESLANLYFTAYGFYDTIGSGQQSIYTAEPPSGPVSDGLVNSYGPPWISLANLENGFSGQFQYFFGFPRGPIGTWSLAPAPAPVAPVPEPASMLLLGSGLAAVAARKYRESKRG